MDTMVSGRAGMSEAEWQARCDLAALYRITELFGWTDTIDTHMSVRIPGEPDCFLINNYGDLFNEITASSLVKLGIDGKVYSTDGRFNAAGFTIHSGVYKARPDANCVMHTHTRAGTGVSVLKKGLRPISQDALAVWTTSSTTSTACRPRTRNARRSASPASAATPWCCATTAC